VAVVRPALAGRRLAALAAAAAAAVRQNLVDAALKVRKDLLRLCNGE